MSQCVMMADKTSDCGAGKRTGEIRRSSRKRRTVRTSYKLNSNLTSSVLNVLFRCLTLH